MKILAINPGSTSTKIAVYENENRLLVKTFYHSPDDLSSFPTILSQYDYRRDLIIDELKRENLFSGFAAIVGRGGLLKPISSGVYEVNELMKNDLRNALMSVESGGSTFRGAGGLWGKYPIEQVATPEGYAANPELVINFYNDMRRQLFTSEPNKGHKLVAELEKEFNVTVVTQNIDDLHESHPLKAAIAVARL